MGFTFLCVTKEKLTKPAKDALVGSCPRQTGCHQQAIEQ